MAKSKSDDGRQFKGVSIRTEGDEVEHRLDRVAAEVAKRAAGVRVTRSTVARSALLRGLEAMENELGLKKST
jgi:hypothetical protein